jgi:hypothetical protein
MKRPILSVITGAVVVLVALELMLQLLPTPSATLLGRYVDARMTTYPPGHSFRLSTGWSFLNAHDHRAGRHGFIPDKPFNRSAKAVALIGDSLVEQAMLPEGHRLASVLERARNGSPVFSMGLGGTSLFDYLERVRYAREQLGVKNFLIVIERADVKQSQCTEGGHKDACLDSSGQIRIRETTSRSTSRDLLARSALLQYFVGVLGVSPDSIWGMFRREVPEDRRQKISAASSNVISPGEHEVIDRFIRELSQLDDVRVGLVIDPELFALQRIEQFGNAALPAMMERARRSGISVIHPRAALAAYSARTGFSMRVGPYDGHWNRLANCVIAAEMQGLFAERDGSRTEPADLCPELR